jgi:hypothetical protein
MATKLKRVFEKLIDRRAPEWMDEQLVRLGNLSGTVLTSTPGKLYARQYNGKVIIVHNGTANVPPIFDLHVRVGRKKSLPNIWQIIQVEEDYDTPAGSGQVAYHHEQHEEGGADRLNLNRKQILQLSVRVQDSLNFIVQVFGDIRQTASGNVLLSTQPVDVSSYVPTAGAIYVAIESDTSGVLSVHSGSVFGAPNIGTAADMPAPIAGKYTRAWILLFEGQAALLDEHIIVPMPFDLNPLDYSGIAHVHNLDDLFDVNAPSPADSEALTWNAYAEEWQPSAHPGTMVIDDLTSQIPAASDHFDLASEATGIVMLFYNTTYQSPSTFTMDVDELGLTTSFSPAAGDTLVAVYGVGAFAIIDDPDAIHDNVAGEINAITQKTVPVAGDKTLIEDSEDSYSKKSADIIDLLWNKVINSPTSFTNWNTGATWSDDGSKLVQSDSGATTRRTYYTVKIPLSGIIYEAEIQQKNDASGAEIGLTIGFDGSGTGGMAVGIRTFNDDVRVSQDGVAQAALFPAVGIAVDTWYILRVIAFGNTVSVRLAGVDIGSARVAHGNSAALYVGVFTNTTAGWFRNIKAWTLKQPL